jgi:hypothetical protein
MAISHMPEFGGNFEAFLRLDVYTSVDVEKWYGYSRFHSSRPAEGQAL